MLLSGVFINDKGVFKFVPFPDEAQVSPVKGIAVADINKDNRLDILLTGNDYGIEVETGRYDASNGIVLVNNGNANFQSIPNRFMNFWQSKDSRNIYAVKNALQKPAWIIANNNAPFAYIQLK